MEKENYFDWFKERVKNEMANCRYRMETQPMSKDLAKVCFEAANAMIGNYQAIKAESGKEDVGLQLMLEDWYNYSKGILQNINSLINMWNVFNVPTTK